MAIPLLDLETLAAACVDGDLEAFAAAPALGWTLTEQARQALLHAVANTNHHRWYSYGVSSFTVAQAIGLMAEAASNESGVAITEQVRSLRLGKEVAIAFRHAGQVHFGVRYASNLPMTPGHLWAELRPWFKVLERNRTRLEQWAGSAEGILAVPLRASPLRASPASEEGSGEQLLAAVVADPDDVEARLVYADWLLARGDAQGELIQLCEQRRVQNDTSLDARIEELQRAYGERIAGDVAQLASSYTIDRGFVRRIEMAAPTFAKHGERLLASHPIERLDLKPVNDKALARLALASALRRVRTLYLSQIIGRERPMSFDELCRSPHLDALRRLEVWTWESSGDPQQAFAGLQAPRLESIYLYEVDSSAEILAGLARNLAVKLRSLRVSLRRRADWTSVFAEPAFERVEQLQVDADGEWVARLFEGASLPALTSLTVGDDVPLTSSSAPSLRRLSLGGGLLDAAAIIELIERHPRLEALQVWTLAPSEVERVLEWALQLPRAHPLEVLALPARDADPQLVARAGERFSGDFYAARPT